MALGVFGFFGLQVLLPLLAEARHEHCHIPEVRWHDAFHDHSNHDAQLATAEAEHHHVCALCDRYQGKSLGGPSRFLELGAADGALATAFPEGEPIRGPTRDGLGPRAPPCLV